MADRDPPNLDRLIKLMKLTTSSNDGEALAAIRAANSALAKFGGDWEKLLLGKVTVVADPFASIATPTPRNPSYSYSRPSAPPPQKPGYHPPPPPPPRPQPAPQWTATQPKPRPTQRRRGSRPIPATADDIFNIFT